MGNRQHSNANSRTTSADRSTRRDHEVQVLSTGSSAGNAWIPSQCLFAIGKYEEIRVYDVSTGILSCRDPIFPPPTEEDTNQQQDIAPRLRHHFNIYNPDLRRSLAVCCCYDDDVFGNDSCRRRLAATGVFASPDDSGAPSPYIGSNLPTISDSMGPPEVVLIDYDAEVCVGRLQTATTQPAESSRPFFLGSPFANAILGVSEHEIMLWGKESLSLESSLGREDRGRPSSIRSDDDETRFRGFLCACLPEESRTGHLVTLMHRSGQIGTKSLVTFDIERDDLPVVTSSDVRVTGGGYTTPWCCVTRDGRAAFVSSEGTRPPAVQCWDVESGMKIAEANLGHMDRGIDLSRVSMMCPLIENGARGPSGSLLASCGASPFPPVIVGYCNGIVEVFDFRKLSSLASFRPLAHVESGRLGATVQIGPTAFASVLSGAWVACWSLPKSIPKTTTDIEARSSDAMVLRLGRRHHPTLALCSDLKATEWTLSSSLPDDAEGRVVMLLDLLSSGVLQGIPFEFLDASSFGRNRLYHPTAFRAES